VSNCTQHVSYLEAGAKGLEQEVAREFVPRVKEARSELLQSLDYFKNFQVQWVEGSIMKAGPKKILAKRGSKPAK
jgi:hypothetical protein